MKNLVPTARQSTRLLPALAFALATAVAPAHAAEPARAAAPAPDKTRYDLFHPTPSAELREMKTDRPDKTENPFTVDAGRFQFEMDVVNFAYDRYNPARDGTIVRTWNIAPINLKAGLLHNLDFQVIVPSFTYIRTTDPAAGSQRQRGFGDLVTRLKWNLWGNDGGATAFALLPYLKLPTSQDGIGSRSVEGGVILPLNVELPAGWGLALMSQFDLPRGVATSSHQPRFVNSVSVGHDLVGELAGYAEFYSSVSTERGAPWVGTVDFGLTYGLTKNIQLDAGINIGVTRSADDWNPFIGLSFRF